MSIKLKIISSLKWTAIERILVQLVQFVFGVILARILIPSDFGLIGMLSIFFAISQIFVDSGMGSAIVQKRNRKQADYSTVFVFNLIVSIFAYCVLYVCAPLIADFFNNEQLISLTRVLSISIIVQAFALVPRTRFTVELNFKTIAKVNFLSTLLAGLIGVVLAYQGFGVWSLVIQMLVRSCLAAMLFLLIRNEKLSFIFEFDSFKELFGYGSKLLLAGIYSQILTNVYNLIIGRKFSATDLGFYTRATNFADVSAGTITSILQQVTFPILSSVNDDDRKMVTIFRSVLQLSAFIIFPLMTLISLLAGPIVVILLTDKWIQVVPYLQLMVFARVLIPLNSINMSLLKAKGRSDLFLKLDLLKLPIIVLVLFIAIPFGIKAMILGQIIISFLAFLMNSYLPGKYLNYGAIKQLRDIWPVLLSTLLMAIVVHYSIVKIESNFFKLMAGAIIGFISYLLSSYIFKVKGLRLIILEIQNLKLNKNIDG